MDCSSLDLCDGESAKEKVKSLYNFDIYALHFLRWVCVKAKVKIVISSTWRCQYDKIVNNYL